MKKFVKLLKLPGRSKDKAAQSGTSDIQWLTELNWQSAASRAEGYKASSEPASAPRDRPACLAEIQELRLRLPQLQRDSNQQSFSGKFGVDAYHVLEGRRELIRVQLLLAGSLIRLVRPLDTTAKGGPDAAAGFSKYGNHNGQQKSNSQLSKLGRGLLACGSDLEPKRQVLLPFYHIHPADRSRITCCKGCSEQICQACSQIEAKVWQLDARASEWSAHQVASSDQQQLVSIRQEADQLWMRLLNLVQQARNRSCMVHEEGSGWKASQPTAKRQKRSGMRRLFDCLNPSNGFGPNTEDEVWRGSSYDTLLDEPAQPLQQARHQQQEANGHASRVASHLHDASSQAPCPQPSGHPQPSTAILQPQPFPPNQPDDVATAQHPFSSSHRLQASLATQKQRVQQVTFSPEQHLQQPVSVLQPLQAPPTQPSSQSPQMGHLLSSPQQQQQDMLIDFSDDPSTAGLPTTPIHHPPSPIKGQYQSWKQQQQQQQNGSLQNAFHPQQQMGGPNGVSMQQQNGSLGHGLQQPQWGSGSRSGMSLQQLQVSPGGGHQSLQPACFGTGSGLSQQAGQAPQNEWGHAGPGPWRFPDPMGTTAIRRAVPAW
ncbi:hypothetical protein WJX74_001535 [Apatococcus lobatus]|uniref:Uncharacterized protein n=1 Tax=Apatococcus lobatus TaxID=904363 RepID=A0AAW1R0K4_9CHLO